MRTSLRMRLIMTAHLAFLFSWLGLAVVLGLQTATLGNEASVLSRQRGEGLRERRELLLQQDVLRTQLDSAARRDLLEVAVRRLGLPLRPEPSAPSGSGPVELARYNQDR